MSLDNQTHSIDLYMTERQTNTICSTCLRVIFTSWAPFGAQEIFYFQNKSNELNFMEA